MFTFSMPDLRGLVLSDEDTLELLNQLKLLFLAEDRAATLSSFPATTKAQALLRPFFEPQQ